MKVFIERTLDGRYTIVKADLYSITIHTNQKRSLGISIFGDDLGEVSYILDHKEIRYKHGVALSAAGTMSEAKQFITNNNMELLDSPCHMALYTELDSRYYRR